MTRKTLPDYAGELEHLQVTLAETQEHLQVTLAETQERMSRITQDLQPLLAEGTSPAAKPVHTQPTAAEVATALEAALRERPRTDRELGRILPGVPHSLVRSAVTRLRRTGRLYNLASAAQPRWAWVPGKDAPAPERYAAIVRMVSERPCTLAELKMAVGCTQGQASGALVQMTREGRPLVNLGNGRSGLWYLPPAAVAQNGPRKKHT